MRKKKKLSLAKAWRSIRYNRLSGLAGVAMPEPQIVVRYTHYRNRLTAIRRGESL